VGYGLGGSGSSCGNGGWRAISVGVATAEDMVGTRREETRFCGGDQGTRHPGPRPTAFRHSTTWTGRRLANVS
jgi:hypothetical protein